MMVNVVRAPLLGREPARREPARLEEVGLALQVVVPHHVALELEAALAALAHLGQGRRRIEAVVEQPLPIYGFGRFRFDAQRNDFYTNPLGVLPVRGTFVAPLITELGPCRS